MTGAAGNRRRNPSSARRDRDDPPFFVGSLNRRRAGREALVKGSIAGAVLLPWLVRRRRSPFLEQILKRVGATLERVRIAGLDRGVVLRPVDLLRSRLRVVLREEALHRFLRRDVRVAVVEVAIGEGEVHRLIEGVHVPGAVVAHRLDVDSSRGCSASAGAPVPASTRSACRPARPCSRSSPALRRAPSTCRGPRSCGARRARGNRGRTPARCRPCRSGRTRPWIASLRLLPALSACRSASTSLRSVTARSACLKISPACGRFALRSRVGQEHVLRVRPLLDFGLLPLDGIGGLRLDRIAVGHLDRGREHVGEAERAEFRQHDHEPAWCSRV